MDLSACLLAHGTLRGGTSDAVAWELSRVTYSPNTTTNKKPALGGLEKAQVLRNLSDASISNSHKTFQHNSTSRRLHRNWG
jgi:hypothetical protein